MKKNCLLSLLALVLIVLFTGPSYAKPVKIAVAPFSVTSKSDLGYLTTGVVDLFTSRLSGTSDILVIDKTKTTAVISQPEKINKGNASEKARALGVDYILFGKIDESAKEITIDSYVAGADPDATMMPFLEKSSQYDSADSILQIVNRIVSRIKKEIFEQETQEKTVEKPVEDNRNIYAHPDTLLKDLDMPKSKKKKAQEK